MINAAIIGLGWWGKNIVQCVQGKSTKLRFVHGVSKETDAALPIAEANGFTLSDDLEQALADKRVQAVVLATPHSLHADQIVRVATAGKPVFCEKPLSLKQADAERAVAACAKARSGPLRPGDARAPSPSPRFRPCRKRAFRDSYRKPISGSSARQLCRKESSRGSMLKPSSS